MKSLHPVKNIFAFFVSSSKLNGSFFKTHIFFTTEIALNAKNEIYNHGRVAFRK
jgi:hypothetical protein